MNQPRSTLTLPSPSHRRERVLREGDQASRRPIVAQVRSRRWLLTLIQRR